MFSDLREIPPSPRLPRWSACLWRRWPLALGAFVLGVYGSLFALMLTYFSAGRPADDRAFNTPGAAIVTPGMLIAWTPTASTLGGEQAWRCHIEFDGAGARSQSDVCYAPASVLDLALDGRDPRTGHVPIDVEYLRSRNYVSRMVGSRVSLMPELVRPVLLLGTLPGLVLLLAWWINVMRGRSTLRRGDVGVAELQSIRQVRFVSPAMLEVRYRFRDRNARLREACHWVRARSELGERLETAPRRLAVVHNRHNPRRNRLVIPQDFDRSPSTPIRLPVA